MSPERAHPCGTHRHIAGWLEYRNTQLLRKYKTGHAEVALSGLSRWWYNEGTRTRSSPLADRGETLTHKQVTFVEYTQMLAQL